jgi:hypothetical protein
MARSTVSRPLDELAEKGEVDAGDQHRRCSARQLRDTGPGAARGPGGCMTGADAHTGGLAGPAASHQRGAGAGAAR